MKVGSRKLLMSSGEVREFKTSATRDRFERYAQAIKNGWRPHGKMASAKGGK